MHRTAILTLLLLIGSVCWGSGPQASQAKPATQAKPPAQSKVALPPPKTKGWIKDPNQVMAMRKMTNAERRKAATRNAERRNAAMRQRHSTPANTGVQQ
jgi:hypothetical protein